MKIFNKVELSTKMYSIKYIFHIEKKIYFTSYKSVESSKLYFLYKNFFKKFI